MGIPSGYRTERRWQTGRTRGQRGLLPTAGQRSLAGPGVSSTMAISMVFFQQTICTNTQSIALLLHHFLLLFCLSSGGLVKIIFKLTTLPRSKFVSCVNPTHSSRCNIRTSCCYPWGWGTLTRPDRPPRGAGAVEIATRESNLPRVVWNLLELTHKPKPRPSRRTWPSYGPPYLPVGAVGPQYCSYGNIDCGGCRVSGDLLSWHPHEVSLRLTPSQVLSSLWPMHPAVIYVTGDHIK